MTFCSSDHGKVHQRLLKLVLGTPRKGHHLDPSLLSVSRLRCVPLLRTTRQFQRAFRTALIRSAGHSFCVTLSMHLNGLFPWCY